MLRWRDVSDVLCDGQIFNKLKDNSTTRPQNMHVLRVWSVGQIFQNKLNGNKNA